jgi:ATP-dependent RNA helicase SUPV3L1/SUV3
VRATRRAPAQQVRQAERRITITLPSRHTPPQRVVAHLGPTNSGKTYAALKELAEKRSGVYAGPLRMLAQEAHRRLGEWIGEEHVGLVTGEERINDRAPVICSTVEMAPHAGELLVLDEVRSTPCRWSSMPFRRPSSRSSSGSSRSSGSVSARSGR